MQLGAMPEETPFHSPAETEQEAVILMPTSLREVWRLLAPWLGYVLLAAAGVLGLATASGGADEATYDAGMTTFVLAVLIIAIRIKRQLDGEYVGLLLPVAVRREDSLAIAIALLGVLGLGGAVVAAAVGGAYYGVGLALFIVSAAIAFREIKRYFDFRDHSG